MFVTPSNVTFCHRKLKCSVGVCVQILFMAKIQHCKHKKKNSIANNTKKKSSEINVSFQKSQCALLLFLLIQEKTQKYHTLKKRRYVQTKLTSSSSVFSPWKLRWTLNKIFVCWEFQVRGFLSTVPLQIIKCFVIGK